MCVVSKLICQACMADTRLRVPYFCDKRDDCNRKTVMPRLAFAKELVEHGCPNTACINNAAGQANLQIKLLRLAFGVVETEGKLEQLPPGGDDLSDRDEGPIKVLPPVIPESMVALQNRGQQAVEAMGEAEEQTPEARDSGQLTPPQTAYDFPFTHEWTSSQSHKLMHYKEKGHYSWEKMSKRLQRSKADLQAQWAKLTGGRTHPVDEEQGGTGSLEPVDSSSKNI